MQYFGSNITGDFVGAVFTDYATSSVAIYNEDASTQGRLFEYTYSPVTASRNTSSVLYNSTGQYVPSSRPWFSHNFTVYSDFSSGDVVVTMSREYFSGGVFQGVFGVDIVVSNLLTYLESFHPVAGVSGSCIALLTTAGELVASSHPLVFGPSAVYGPVSKLPILNNNGSLPLDPFAGAMQLVFQEYASLDLITESFTVVTSDYVVAVYPLTGSNTQTFKSGGVVLPLVVIAAVSTEAYLPTIAGRIGGSVALTVLGIAVIVLFGWKGPSVLSKLTGGGGGGHGEHGGGHGGGGHGGGSHGGGGHGDHSTDASPFVTAVGFLGSTLLCFLVYYIWSYNDSTLIREPASYLALQSSLHFTQVVQGFSIQTAAVNFLDLFLLNTSNSPAPYAVYAPSTPIELHSIARIESFLTVLVSTLTISEPIVAQVMFGFDDGLLLGARADAQGIHIVASDDSTYGHLTLFDTTVNGTRNASAATEGLLYDPRRQDWWLQVVDEEVGHPVWSGVRQLFGEVVMGMTQSAKLVVNQSRTVVVAVDISTTLMSQNLGSLNITQYGGSGVVVSGSIKEMSIVASSADNYPFAFDSNGSMHSVPALQRWACVVRAHVWSCI